MNVVDQGEEDTGLVCWTTYTTDVAQQQGPTRVTRARSPGDAGSRTKRQTLSVNEQWVDRR